METINRVIEIIKLHIDSCIDVEPATLLSEDVGIGSFDQLMIINAIEDEYKIEFSSNDFKEIKTVSDIAHILDTRYLIKK